MNPRAPALHESFSCDANVSPSMSPPNRVHGRWAAASVTRSHSASAARVLQFQQVGAGPREVACRGDDQLAELVLVGAFVLVIEPVHLGFDDQGQPVSMAFRGRVRGQADMPQRGADAVVRSVVEEEFASVGASLSGLRGAEVGHQPVQSGAIKAIVSLHLQRHKHAEPWRARQSDRVESAGLRTRACERVDDPRFRVEHHLFTHVSDTQPRVRVAHRVTVIQRQRADRARRTHEGMQARFEGCELSVWIASRCSGGSSWSIDPRSQYEALDGFIVTTRLVVRSVPLTSRP